MSDGGAPKTGPLKTGPVNLKTGPVNLKTGPVAVPAQAAPPPPVLASRDGPDVATLGKSLLQHLFAASRLGAMWGYESKLANEALANLMTAVQAAASSYGEATLRFANEMVYLHDHRLRVDFSGYMAVKHIQDRAARNGVGEIRIPSSAPVREVIELLKALEARAEENPEVNAFDATTEALRAAGVSQVSVGPPREGEAKRGHLGPQDVNQAAAQAYFRLLYQARKCASHDESTRKVQVRKLKRAIHEAIDVLLRGETTLLALAQVKNYYGYAANHATNVCILATALGLRIGMHKRLAADLGLAALLHESIAPPTSAAKADEGGATACDARAGHASRKLLPELGFHDAGVRTVLAARDVHAPARDAQGKEGPLFHRVLRAVCFYDAMTTPAAGAASTPSSREVIAAMLRDDGTRFDPVVVRALRGMVGLYPFGTVVELDTGERGIVQGRNPHFEQPARPVVRIVRDAQGQEVEDGAAVDLSKWDRQQNRFARSIAKALAPHEAFEQPSEYVRVLGV